jgi:hypothetical protein
MSKLAIILTGVVGIMFSNGLMNSSRAVNIQTLNERSGGRYVINGELYTSSNSKTTTISDSTGSTSANGCASAKRCTGYGTITVSKEGGNVRVISFRKLKNRSEGSFSLIEEPRYTLTGLVGSISVDDRIKKIKIVRQEGDSMQVILTSEGYVRL